jgi:tetratricopeptide (TPR) repeat protein
LSSSLKFDEHEKEVRTPAPHGTERLFNSADIVKQTLRPDEQYDSTPLPAFNEGEKQVLNHTPDDRVQLARSPAMVPGISANVDDSEVHPPPDISPTSNKRARVSYHSSDDEEDLELTGNETSERPSLVLKLKIVAPQALGQGKEKSSFALFDQDDDHLYESDDGFDSLINAWNVTENISAESAESVPPSQDSGFDESTPFLSFIEDANEGQPTTYIEISHGEAENAAAPKQARFASSAGAQTSLRPTVPWLYGTRLVGNLDPCLVPAAMPETETSARGLLDGLWYKMSKVETTDSVSAFETLKAVNNLAEALEELAKLSEHDSVHLYIEAEFLYRRAIVVFGKQESDGFQHRLDSLLHLGRLLCRKQQQECYEEAKLLLADAVTGYKKLGLHHLEFSALGSLLEVQLKLRNTLEQDVTMFRMWMLLQLHIDSIVVGLVTFLLEAIRLAKEYYCRGGLENAQSVLRSTVPKLELLDDIQHGVEKAEGYIQYSCLCQGKESWEEAVKYLQLAQDIETKTSQLDAEVVQFIESRLKEISLLSKGSYKSPWDKFRSSSVGRAPMRISQMSRGREFHEQETSQNSTTQGSTASHKYGVTFSDNSSITGVSISESLNPSSSVGRTWMRISQMSREREFHEQETSQNSTTQGSTASHKYGVTFSDSSSITGVSISEFLDP